MRVSVIIRYREPHDKSRQVSFYFEKKERNKNRPPDGFRRKIREYNNIRIRVFLEHHEFLIEFTRMPRVRATRNKVA